MTTSAPHPACLPSGPNGEPLPLCADTVHLLSTKPGWVPVIEEDPVLGVFIHIADEQETEEDRRLVEEAHTCSGCGAKYPEAIPERCPACGTRLTFSHAEVMARLEERFGRRGVHDQRAALPEGVLRAMRNARPGRLDTEQEKDLFARRRLEPSILSDVVTAEVEALREGGK